MITVLQDQTSFSVTLRHVTVLRTQPIHFAFRAPTGKQVPLRKRSSSKSYTLLFGLHGSFYVHEKGSSFALVPNALLLIPAKRAFGITVEENSNASFLAIEFEISPENFILDLTENGSLYFEKAKTFKPFLDELQELPLDRYAAGEALLLTLFEKLRYETEEKESHERLYRHTLSYIKRHFADPPTSTRAAFGTHYSSDYLSRIFKKAYNMTLSELIKYERLEILKNYLRFTSYPLDRIASILAFSSVAAMNAFFKYHTDMTPTEYKNRLKKHHINERDFYERKDSL